MSALEVWAPEAQRVRACVGPTESACEAEMLAVDDGWWRLPGEALLPDTDYAFLINDSDVRLPDPRSLRQPYGVHGASRTYNQQAFVWSDESWPGRDLQGAILYELHIGTFTPGATFDSAIERLDHLVDLGVTHVEILPVNDFNGVWNWGYDGVDWYAVHEQYGGPDGLKRFVDAAHRRGLAVVLDVVYNHLGPSGNYLPKFGPYLKKGRNTWGDLVNLELPQIRRFILDNALMWLREYHIDGLRLDAVHALVDTSPTHILRELADEVQALSLASGRPVTLIAESDLNDAMMVTPPPDGYGLDAQWDDDVHHALHALLTGERQGYYDDFGSLECVAKVLTKAFFHDGTYSTFRERPHGHPVDREHVPGYRFVVCLQNHDQVGNRAAGDRLCHSLSPSLLRVGAVLLMTSPYTPMLWMGEEWAASTPWPFFTSHPEPELAKATADGRIEEFATHGWRRENVVDPQDPEAYRSAILRWDEVATGEHAEMFDFYRRLIRLRRDYPALSDPRLDKTSVAVDEASRTVVIDRGALTVLVNLSDDSYEFAKAAEEIVFSTGDAQLDVGVVTAEAMSAMVVRNGPPGR